MIQTLLSRQDLAKRWNLNPRTIIYYEQNGIIRRVPKLQVPRYSLSEVEEIENEGLDINPTLPLERRSLEKKIKDLEKELNFYKEKFADLKMLIG